MCSIVGLTGKISNMGDIFIEEKNIEYFKEVLNIKGGDEYSIVLNIDGLNKQVFTYDFTKIKNILLKSQYINNDCFILMFSRLTPEMEQSESSIPQPYYNRFTDTWYAVHGTIPSAEKFCDLKVDTEIFNYAKTTEEAIEFVEKQNGKISMLAFKNYNSINANYLSYTNGLGMYSYKFCGVNMYSNIDLSTTNQNYVQDKKELPNTINTLKPKTRIISLFSGGLDITCSTWKIIDNYNEEIIRTNGSIDLWYFDWNTRAKFQEVSAGKLMRDKICNKYDIMINYDTLEVDNIFKNTLDVCNLKSTRLTDKNVEGAGSHEAEAAISYVPMRNTLLLTLAAARAEQLYPNDKCIFVIGANLSEGMIYLDNSETFINRMNQLVKVAGQNSYNFEVQAPYKNCTKTKMIEDAIENNYDFQDSFSCYFPKENGEPCGECGSCLLRETALKRSKNKKD